MKILMVSPTPSHPQDAGNRLRIFRLLESLKAFGHTVHFVYIAREAIPQSAHQQMMVAWDAYYSIPYSRGHEKPSLSGGVFGIDDWHQPSIDAFLKPLIQAEVYDAVIVEYVFFSKILNLVPKTTVKIIDTHDMFADRHLRLDAMGLPRAYFYTTVAEENKGLSRADIVLAIQEDEANLFRARIRKPVITIGHAMATQAAPRLRQRTPGAPATVGYIGSSNPINVRSIQTLLDACAARDDAGATTFTIAGSVGAKLTLPEILDVTLMGELDEVAPFYDAVDIVLNPSIGGTGLKIKTVEALEMGTPLLSTRSGTDGMSASSPFHLAQTIEDMAEALATISEPDVFDACVQASLDLRRAYDAQTQAGLAIFADKRRLVALAHPPKVVIVTDIRFWRRSLGKEARLYELINDLATRVAIKVYFLGSLWRAENDLIAACQTPAEVYSANDFVDKTAKPGLPPSGLTPFERKKYADGYFKGFEAFCKVHPCQAMILEYVMTSYFRLAKGAPRFMVLDTHDVMSVRTQTFRKVGIPHHVILDMKEELTILSKFDISIAIQREEYGFLKSALGESHVAYIPHSVSPQRGVFIRDEVLDRLEADETGMAGPRGKRIVFVGGDSPMNVDGMKWFLRECWPAIRLSGAHLFVAGMVCNVIKAPGDEQVHLLGKVEDLERLYGFCDIGINPTYYGGGLKIKTVEYLANGLPAVVSPEGARGIPSDIDDAMIVAPSRAVFIASIMRLVLDGEMRARVSTGARALAAREYSGRQARAFATTLGHAL